MGFYVVGKLRRDADLKILYNGLQRRGDVDGQENLLASAISMNLKGLASTRKLTMILNFTAESSGMPR